MEFEEAKRCLVVQITQGPSDQLVQLVVVIFRARNGNFNAAASEEDTKVA